MSTEISLAADAPVAQNNTTVENRVQFVGLYGPSHSHIDKILPQWIGDDIWFESPPPGREFPPWVFELLAKATPPDKRTKVTVSCQEKNVTRSSVAVVCALLESAAWQKFELDISFRGCVNLGSEAILRIGYTALLKRQKVVRLDFEQCKQSLETTRALQWIREQTETVTVQLGKSVQKLAVVIENYPLIERAGLTPPSDYCSRVRLYNPGTVTAPLNPYVIVDVTCPDGVSAPHQSTTALDWWGLLQAEAVNTVRLVGTLHPAENFLFLANCNAVALVMQSVGLTSAHIGRLHRKLYNMPRLLRLSLRDNPGAFAPDQKATLDALRDALPASIVEVPAGKTAPHTVDISGCGVVNPSVKLNQFAQRTPKDRPKTTWKALLDTEPASDPLVAPAELAEDEEEAALAVAVAAAAAAAAAAAEPAASAASSAAAAGEEYAADYTGADAVAVAEDLYLDLDPDLIWSDDDDDAAAAAASAVPGPQEGGDARRRRVDPGEVEDFLRGGLFGDDDVDDWPLGHRTVLLRPMRRCKCCGKWKFQN